jgi:apolipoprotein D and lipocalin family protein
VTRTRFHAIFCLLLAVAMPVRAAEPVHTVPQLDLSRYAGLWHEIARLPSHFQRDCASYVTAQYTLRQDDLIGVRNTCRDADGDLLQAQGVARTVAGAPGRLQVRFAPDWLAWLPLVWADYWVIALDPGYQWAMVGTPDRDYLWILSRTPGMDRVRYDDLSARARAMGFAPEDLILTAPLYRSEPGKPTPAP